jgi:hypothetical protein
LAKGAQMTRITEPFYLDLGMLKSREALIVADISMHKLNIIEVNADFEIAPGHTEALNILSWLNLETIEDAKAFLRHKYAPYFAEDAYECDIVRDDLDMTL